MYDWCKQFLTAPSDSWKNSSLDNERCKIIVPCPVKKREKKIRDGSTTFFCLKVRDGSATDLALSGLKNERDRGGSGVAANGGARRKETGVQTTSFSCPWMLIW